MCLCVCTCVGDVKGAESLAEPLTECLLAPAGAAVMPTGAANLLSRWRALSTGHGFSVRWRWSWRVLSNALPKHSRAPWFFKQSPVLGCSGGSGGGPAACGLSFWSPRSPERLKHGLLRQESPAGKYSPLQLLGAPAGLAASPIRQVGL